MLTIRMQRTGRKGLAQFRVIVQDSRFSPSSGRVVAQLGFYNPHTKETNINKEKVAEYLKNGAQPSERVVKLLEAEKVKLPAWVEKSRTDREGKIRNAEKLRKNRPDEPAEPAKPAATEEPAAEEPESAEDAEKPAEAEAEAPAEEAKSEEPAADPAPEADEAPAAEAEKDEKPSDDADASAAEEKPADA